MSELEQIKWLLVAIFVVLSVLSVAGISALMFVGRGIHDVSEISRRRTLRLLGEEYLDQGEHDNLIDLCRSTLQTHPNHPWARYYLGIALYRTNAFPEARAVLEHLARDEPDWIESITPWIEEIDARFQANPPKLV